MNSSRPAEAGCVALELKLETRVFAQSEEVRAKHGVTQDPLVLPLSLLSNDPKSLANG